MISFIQSCSIDTTAYFSILTTIIIKVHKNNFQIINLSQGLPVLHPWAGYIYKTDCSHDGIIDTWLVL